MHLYKTKLRPLAWLGMVAGAQSLKWWSFNINVFSFDAGSNTWCVFSLGNIDKNLQRDYTTMSLYTQEKKHVTTCMHEHPCTYCQWYNCVWTRGLYHDGSSVDYLVCTRWSIAHTRIVKRDPKRHRVKMASNMMVHRRLSALLKGKNVMTRCQQSDLFSSANKRLW